MDWLKDIIYFDIDQKDNTLVFIPKKIIHDIYFDNTTVIIPYTNGKCYLVYQDITLKIIKYFESINSRITIQLNKDKVIPEIIITKIDIDDSIISIINTIMTNYINSKFMLFVN